MGFMPQHCWMATFSTLTVHADAKLASVLIGCGGVSGGESKIDVRSY